MDFIDWCGVVLDGVSKALQATPSLRVHGVSERHLEQALFGRAVLGDETFSQSTHRRGMRQAIEELVKVGLLETARLDRCWLPSRDSRWFTTDPTPLWSSICDESLNEEEAQLVRVVNRLSVQGDGQHSWLEWVEREALLTGLGCPGGTRQLQPVLTALNDLGFLVYVATLTRLDVQATYKSLVWETRRAFTVQSACIDRLVAEWENTSVDFKREVHTGTADERAELVKDVLALANTQAAGRRWLVIGFDDKARAYHGPPDPKLTQNHIEQLLARCTDPAIDVRYEVWGYRAGPVGMLEVLRRPAKVPYHAQVAITGANNKVRLREGQVFVRHGSQVEEPTEAERQALQEEGDRARASTG